MPLDRDRPFVSEPPELAGAKRVGDLQHAVIEALAGGLTKAQADLLYDQIGAAAAAVVALGAAAGTWTPAHSLVANLDGSTAFDGLYLKFGAIVLAACRVSVDPTAPATETILGLALPVASDFSAIEQCVGVAFASGIAGQGASIRADATNNRAEMVWIASDVSNQAMTAIFVYRVI